MGPLLHAAWAASWGIELTDNPAASACAEHAGATVRDTSPPPVNAEMTKQAHLQPRFSARDAVPLTVVVVDGTPRSCRRSGGNALICRCPGDG
jgi:hypothetical protein